jgi:hypothetical protein
MFNSSEVNNPAKSSGETSKVFKMLRKLITRPELRNFNSIIRGFLALYEILTHGPFKGIISL